MLIVEVGRGEELERFCCFGESAGATGPPCNSGARRSEALVWRETCGVDSPLWGNEKESVASNWLDSESVPASEASAVMPSASSRCLVGILGAVVV